MPNKRLTVAEYLVWAESAPTGRYELVRGEVVEISPERAWHNRMKGALYMALHLAIRRAGLPDCTAYTDGMTVQIDDQTAREPDALVQCSPIPLDSLIANEPVIVVEVASPSSARSDVSTKLADYFTVPSIQHYLVVDMNSGLLLHTRQADGEILPRIIRDGDVHLDPPGLVIPFAEMVPTLDECAEPSVSRQI